MADHLNDAAERAIASVVEAECPLCKAGSRIHADRASYSCFGNSYVVSSNRLAVMQPVWTAQ